LETVTIRARINANKKVEFFQTMESLKPLITNYCNDLQIKFDENNNCIICITFDGRDELESMFYNTEFDIIKGSVRSVSDNYKILINEDILLQ
jgi:hypothetical protein